MNSIEQNARLRIKRRRDIEHRLILKPVVLREEISPALPGIIVLIASPELLAPEDRDGPNHFADDQIEFNAPAFGLIVLGVMVEPETALKAGESQTYSMYFFHVIRLSNKMRCKYILSHLRLRLDQQQ